MWQILRQQLRNTHVYSAASRMVLTTMEWLRWVGSLELQVSFAEYCLFDRALLQKRPIVCFIVTTHVYSAASRMVLTTMGWLRLVGSLELQVSFAEYCLFDRAILPKRPIICFIVTTHVYSAVSCTVSTTMGWLWLVGSLKLQVSFAEYCPFYRAILQKRPIICFHCYHSCV